MVSLTRLLSAVWVAAATASALQRITLRDLVRRDADHSTLLRALRQSIEPDIQREIQFEGIEESFPVSRPVDRILELNANYSDILFEGDIRLSEAAVEALIGGDVIDQAEVVIDVGGENEAKRRRRQALTNEGLLWKSGVPYAIDTAINTHKRNVIEQAVASWARETCINFIKRTKETHYIYFVGHDEGCWSTVGSDTKQGQQWISIGNGCDTVGIVMHEIGHALGVFHQQSRPDRDSFVTIAWSRIQRNFETNFAKAHCTTSHGLAYDFGSVMHYGPTSFTTRPKLATISSKDANYFMTMGSRDGPSFLDVALVNKLYSCQARLNCLTPLCQNGGFPDSRKCGRCKCPPQYSGQLCGDRSYGHTSCGTLLLRAEPTWTAFERRTRAPKQCIVHVESPANSRIEFELQQAEGTCDYGCSKDRTEFRVGANPLVTGYRFCCKQSGSRRFTSMTSTTSVILKANTRTAFVRFRYRAVQR